jgi:hypothetical protein
MSFISGKKAEKFCASTVEMKKFISGVHWLNYGEDAPGDVCSNS